MSVSLTDDLVSSFCQGTWVIREESFKQICLGLEQVGQTVTPKPAFSMELNNMKEFFNIIHTQMVFDVLGD